MTDTKVDTLLASWPSTMDTPGDADKMQAMVSLARGLEAALTAAEKGRDGLFADTTALTDMLGDETARRVAAEKRIGELEGERNKSREDEEVWRAEWVAVSETAAALQARAEDSKSRLSALQSAIEQKDGALRELVRLQDCLLASLVSSSHRDGNRLREEYEDGLDAAMEAARQALQLSPDAAGGVRNVLIGHLVEIPDGLGTLIVEWNDERYKLRAGTPVYAALPDAAGEQADTTRDAVIEECAKVCRDQAVERRGQADSTRVLCGRDFDALAEECDALCAAILALKPTHPDQSPVDERT